MGTVTVPCPCGSLTGILGVYATRECRGNCSGISTWGGQDVSQCLDRYRTALDICRVSEVSSLQSFPSARCIVFIEQSALRVYMGESCRTMF